MNESSSPDSLKASLSDFIDVDSLEENGVVRSQDKKRWGFLFRLKGIHAELLSRDEIWQLHQSLRSLSDLQDREEMKIVLHNCADLLPLVQSRLAVANQIEGTWAQEFYQKLLFSKLEGMGNFLRKLFPIV